MTACSLACPGARRSRHADPASPATARAPTTVTDAGGRQVKVGDTSRIVSIGGDVTEILYALNATPKIVAVDSTSTFPVTR